MIVSIAVARINKWAALWEVPITTRFFFIKRVIERRAEM